MKLNRMLVCLLSVCAAATLCAQESHPLTSVSVFKVDPGKTAAFVAKAKAFVPLMDKLLAEGTISAYGVDVDIFHNPKEPNVAFWADTKNFASFAKFEKSLDQFEGANPALMQDLMGLADMSAHQDLMVRSLEGNGKTPPAGATPTVHFYSVRVKEGKMDEYLALFRKYQKPVLDKLVEDGTIYSYSVDVEAIHSSAPGGVWRIISMPDIGAMDKVQASILGAFEKLSEGEKGLVEAAGEYLTVPGSHRDSVSVSVIFKSK